MISALISIALSLGLPAVITGIIGKVAPGWIATLSGIGGLGKFLQPIVQLCMGLVDILLMIVRWFAQKLLAGLDHIVASVPATMTALSLMWGSYAYGTGNVADLLPTLSSPAPVIERAAPKPAPAPVSRDDIRTPGDWIREALGG